MGQPLRRLVDGTRGNGARTEQSKQTVPPPDSTVRAALATSGVSFPPSGRSTCVSKAARYQATVIVMSNKTGRGYAVATAGSRIKENMDAR